MDSVVEFLLTEANGLTVTLAFEGVSMVNHGSLVK